MTERKTAATLNGTTPVSLDASLSPFLTQLTAGLGEQIKAMVSEASAAVVAEEKESILNEFRAHLRDEATKTLEQVIAASKQELTSRALEKHEAVAKAAYESWVTKIDQDLQSFSSNIEQNMNSARRKAVEQFNHQVGPMLGETQAALKKLETVQDQLKVNLVTMCQQFDEFMQEGTAKSSAQMQEKIAEFAKQFQSDVDERVTAAHSSAVEIGSRFESLGVSAAEQATKVLKERVAELSRQSLSELETRTRRHLEFISESIAEIAKKKV